MAMDIAELPVQRDWLSSANSWALVLLGLGLSFEMPRAVADDWLQSGYDAAHRGFNPTEHTLGPANVGSMVLVGKIMLPDPGAASGVVLSGVSTPSGSHDVMFLSSGSGTLLALDVGSRSILWSRPTSGDAHAESTPAIDPSRQYVYFFGADGKVHKYAVDDGAESLEKGWPQTATLKPEVEHAASGLTIGQTTDGQRYLYAVTDGYNGDGGDYQGHLTTINLDSGAQSVFNALCSDVPAHFIAGGQPGINDCASRRAGIWGRPGATFDQDAGRLYVVTGNGPFDALMGGHDWGDSVLTLSADGTGMAGMPLDSYTPTTYQELEDDDIDLGSGSVAVVGTMPGYGQRLGVVDGKDGIVRLVSLDDLSGAGAPGNIGGELQAIASSTACKCSMPQPAVWDAPDESKWVYATSNGVHAYQVVVNDGQPRLQEKWNTNFSSSSTFATSPVVANGVLYLFGGIGGAFDAVTGELLWQAPVDYVTSRSSPVVVNGRLYSIGQSAVDIFAPDAILADGFELRTPAR